MADDWPYDADQHDPLAKLRIPVVGSAYPGWKYEVCLMITDDENALWPSLRPDEGEVRQILAYLEYRMAYYTDGWKAKIRQRPLDTHATTNTVILRKRPDGGWCYRRVSWRTGPLMIPTPDGERLTLEVLLDKINDPVPEKWAAWKVAHPEAFAGVPSNG